jgi:hypothetical protein
VHGSSCTLNSNFLLNTSNNNIDEEDEGIGEQKGTLYEGSPNKLRTLFF